MNKLKSKLFEYGTFGKILWLIILINVISFVVGIIYNVLAWVFMTVSGIFRKKSQPKMNPWEE